MVIFDKIEWCIFDIYHWNNTASCKLLWGSRQQQSKWLAGRIWDMGAKGWELWSSNYVIVIFNCCWSLPLTFMYWESNNRAMQQLQNICLLWMHFRIKWFLKYMIVMELGKLLNAIIIHKQSVYVCHTHSVFVSQTLLQIPFINTNSVCVWFLLFVCFGSGPATDDKCFLLIVYYS